MSRNQIIFIVLVALIIYAIMENDPRMEAMNNDTVEKFNQLKNSREEKNDEYYENLTNEEVIGLLKDTTYNEGENKLKSSSKPKPKSQINKVVTEDPAPVLFEDAFIAYNSLSIPLLRIRVKNISNKSIDAIKCKIECFNRFDEKMINPISNSHIGFITCENIIHPNETGCALTGYSLDWQEGTTKIKIKVTKVHFEDGSIWTPNSNNQVNAIAKTVL